MKLEKMAQMPGEISKLVIENIRLQRMLELQTTLRKELATIENNKG